MIDKDTLIRYAKLNGIKPWQQEKHYIQSAILVSLSEYPLVFKGGTYLWFFHGLDRFSEDLDFTASGSVPEDLNLRISNDLKLFGIENTTRVISNDETTLTLRLSAKGPLYTSDVDLCHVYVEISKREKVLKKTQVLELKLDAYNLPLKIMNGMNLDEVAAEKIRAIIARDRARDIYDLFYLITKKSVRFDEELVNEKLKYYNEKFSKELFLSKVHERKKEWKRELQSLIFGNLPSFDESFAVIENWLELRVN